MLDTRNSCWLSFLKTSKNIERCWCPFLEMYILVGEKCISYRIKKGRESWCRVQYLIRASLVWGTHESGMKGRPLSWVCVCCAVRDLDFSEAFLTWEQFYHPQWEEWVGGEFIKAVSTSLIFMLPLVDTLGSLLCCAKRKSHKTVNSAKLDRMMTSSKVTADAKAIQTFCLLTW